MEKEIRNFKGYFINEEGEVFNFKGKLGSRRVMSQIKRPDGYVQVGLMKDSKQLPVYIHRIIAEAFIPNESNLPCVNHKDSNRSNNSIDNLEWCTHLENSQHALVNNRFNAKKGEESATAILTNAQVKEIMDRLSNKERVKDLAIEFGVKPSTICGLKSGRRFKDITSSYDIENNYKKYLNNKEQIEKYIEMGIAYLKLEQIFNIPRRAIKRFHEKNNNDIV